MLEQEVENMGATQVARLEEERGSEFEGTNARDSVRLPSRQLSVRARVCWAGRSVTKIFDPVSVWQRLDIKFRIQN